MSDKNTPELSGDLASLAAVADAGDAQVAGAALPPGQEPQPERDPGAEMAAMLQMGVMMLTPVLPFLPQCYPKATCEQIGTAFAAVAEKHGWNLDAMNSPELALAVASVPPTIAAVLQGRAYFAQKKAETEAAEKAKREGTPLPSIAPQDA